MLPSMGGLLLASLLLGLTYNRASPLGVRSSMPEPVKNMPAVPQPARPAKGYYNETISVTLEGAATQGAGTVSPGQSQIPALTWPEVKAQQARNQVVLIDARAAQYYQAGHIPGAVSLPANSFGTLIDTFRTMYATNTALVIYCTSPQCPLSHKEAEILMTQYGYGNIKVMPGGYQEYSQMEGGAK
jgi:rhodanese-related sulfurtransferase